MIDINQFFGVFFEEASELLAEMETRLLSVGPSAFDPENCNAIFRAAHSIKGGAATFGLADMTDLAHAMEALLDSIRKGEIKPTERQVNVCLQAKDMLRAQLEAHQRQQPLEPAAAAELAARLRACAGMLPGPPAPPDPPAAGVSRFRIELPVIDEEELAALVAEFGLNGKADRGHLADGRPVLTVETSETLEGVLATCAFLLNPEDINIFEEPPQPPDAGTPMLPPEIRSGAVGRKTPGSDAEAGPKDIVPPEAAPAAHGNRRASDAPPGVEANSIRVNLGKVDQLINLVGELVITQAMIDQYVGQLDQTAHTRLLNGLETLARNTRDLQDAVMSMRMMPVEFVFSRFPRLVRDLSTKLGKKARLDIQGGATELDKGLIERIIDPLTHLVRNSLDHGLEPPAARLAAGKPEIGVIRLSAAHENGNIVLEVGDDGAGLDRGRILAKARQLGMDVADTLSDEELWPLVFAPGFSTVAEVTEVSGRGVGMDVVKRNIAALDGRVEIRSTPGQGTTVTISLPLTLAILEGMSIRLGDEIYILPLASVVESLCAAPENIREIAGQGRVALVRDEYLPLIRLHELFGVPASSANAGIIVVLEAEGKKAALWIDELLGQQQVVVKSLDANYRRIPRIAGATILGDGNVALILDVPSLLNPGDRATPGTPALGRAPLKTHA